MAKVMIAEEELTRILQERQITCEEIGGGLYDGVPYRKLKIVACAQNSWTSWIVEVYDLSKKEGFQLMLTL